jgi:hypothetical protein
MSAQSAQVVCFETFRRDREGRRARVLPYLVPSAASKSPFHDVELTKREIEHRHRMLQHLAEGGSGTSEEAPYSRPI